jgi:hypothetical protein
MRAHTSKWGWWIPCCFLVVALSACGKGGGSTAIDAAWSCPDDRSELGSECPASDRILSCTFERDGGLSIRCVCSGYWYCSTCPDDFQSPEATCTPGVRCTYDTWEHGCDCQCNDQGRWQCTKETIGSYCPDGSEIDAGLEEDEIDAGSDETEIDAGS